MKRVRYWTMTAAMIVASFVAIQYLQHRAIRHGIAIGFVAGYTAAVRDLDDSERGPLPDAPAAFDRRKPGFDI